MRVPSIVRRLSGPMLMCLLAAQGRTQTPHGQPTPAEIEKMEATLKTTPRAHAIRSALLEYYLHGQLDPAVAIPARRRHILWVIENAPDSDIAYGSLVNIDPAATPLADVQGFKLASTAWRAQTGKPDVKPMTLANAAYFFHLDDKPFAIGLLKRALIMDPTNKEIAKRLGDEYALLILGVTAVNGSNYPVRNDPDVSASSAAMQAREELNSSHNPYMVAKAGYQLLWQGDVLYYSHRLTFDPRPLAKAALQRAVGMAPDDKEVAALRGEFEKFEGGTGETAPRRETARPVEPAAPLAPAAAPPAATEEAAAPPADPPPPPPPPAVTADDLKKVTVGMSREDLLKIGEPTARISVEDDDGHMIEIFQYVAKGVKLGNIDVKDGAVSRIQLR